MKEGEEALGLFSSPEGLRELARVLGARVERCQDTRTRNHLQLEIARLQAGPLEEAARQAPDHLIVRTCGLYGEIDPRRAPHSFLEKILRRFPDGRVIARTDVLRTYEYILDWREGFLLTVLLGAVLAFVVPLLALAVPLMDTLLSIVRRIRSGRQRRRLHLERRNREVQEQQNGHDDEQHV